MLLSVFRRQVPHGDLRLSFVKSLGQLFRYHKYLEAKKNGFGHKQLTIGQNYS